DAKAPPTPRGGGELSGGSAGRGVSNQPLRTRLAMRSNARVTNNTVRPASIAKGRAESATGNPRAACPSKTDMYQRNGRMEVQTCANVFMPMVGKPTPA